MTDATGNGAGGVVQHYDTFTNASATTCLLGGYPKVVASEPGHADVSGTDGHFIGGGNPDVTGFDLAPKASSNFTVETSSVCPTNPETASGPIYHHVVVTLAGGGDLVLPDTSFDLICGLHVLAFPPTPTASVAPADPIAALTVTLVAPPRLQAGTTTVYAVVLTNPTASTVTLDTCPDFLQLLQGTVNASAAMPPPSVKDPRRLNCAQARPIPPHEREYFLMQMAVPAAADSGPATLTWDLTGAPGEGRASALVEVQAALPKP